MLFGVVAGTVLAPASGALAHQNWKSALRGHAASLTFGGESVAGPAWVVQDLPWSRGDGGGGQGDHSGSGGWGGGGWDGGGWGGGGDHRDAFKCDGTFTGLTVKNLVVEPSAVCLLTNSVIQGDVRVRAGADFEAGNTSIAGSVKGYQALTIYLYSGSSVGGHLRTRDTSQVFAFNSTIGDSIRVVGSTDQVFLCNNTVGDGIAVLRSGPNILVGDHLDPNCAGNIVQHGNLVVADNATYVELVVGDNSVLDGSMFVIDNTGTPTFTSGESVLGNQGGDTLACFGNAAPFVGSPNPGWLQYGGQCSA